MALDSMRERINPILDRTSKPFMRFNPNVLTETSFLLALIAGILLAITGRYLDRYFLIFPFILIIFSSFLDAIDGFVARKRNISSKAGDMLDHTFDRYSDIALITGFSFSIFGNLYLGILALGGVFMTSYMGTQAQALGLKRNYGGILGRADRLVLMLVVILIELIFPFNYYELVNITPFTVMLIFFFLAGYITSAERFVSSMKGLEEQE